MFVDCVTAAETLGDSVVVSESLADLYVDDLQRPRESRAKLLCLRGGLQIAEIRDSMRNNSWPIELVKELRLRDGDHWLIADNALSDRTMTAKDIPAIGACAGIDGVPTGNVRCTWPIRRYDERTSVRGGLTWFEELLLDNQSAPGIVQFLLHYLIRLMQSAREHDASLFVEQVSVILTKDAQSNNKCLTPRLHADEYYGHRETAVLSLLESGWSETGGTWFFPNQTIADYPDGYDIRPDHIVGQRFINTAVVYPGNGDLCIYDGMQDSFGKARIQAGLPHISGDIAGRSSRLVVLMNHVSPDQSLTNV